MGSGTLQTSTWPAGTLYQSSRRERRASTSLVKVALSVRSDLPYKSWDEVKKSGKELVVGTTGPGSNAHDFPLLLKEFAGANFKLVSGYPANADVLLAIERKEVDVWAAFATTIKLAADRGAVRPIVRRRVALPGWENLPVDEYGSAGPLHSVRRRMPASAVA